MYTCQRGCFHFLDNFGTPSEIFGYDRVFYEKSWHSKNLTPSDSKNVGRKIIVCMEINSRQTSKLARVICHVRIVLAHQILTPRFVEQVPFFFFFFFFTLTACKEPHFHNPLLPLFKKERIKVKPLSGPHIKRTPCIKRTPASVSNFSSHIYCKMNLYSADADT